MFSLTRLPMVLVFVCVLVVCFGATAAEKRILVVGDSWAAGINGNKLLDPALAAVGLSNYIADFRTSETTSIYGASAAWFAEPAQLALITAAFQTNPDITIVHLSLGGNDFLGSVLLNPTPPSSPAEWDAFHATVVNALQTIIAHIQSLKPGIRIAICGYTHLDFDQYYSWPNSLTSLQLRTAVVDLSEQIKDMTLSIDRCVYIQNFGLMQYEYGYPSVYAPYEVPYPGDAPDYTPFPGGDINYPAPAVAMNDAVHLTKAGYAFVAEKCVDQYYADWLQTPDVVSITRRGLFNDYPIGADEVSFDVSFSLPVSGVDVSDFVVTTVGVTGASVVAVTGESTSYVVTVDTGEGNGTLRLDVADDNSIVYNGAYSLGGAGAGDGDYVSGEYFDIDRAYPLSLAHWAVFTALLATGLVLLSVRSRRWVKVKS